MSKHRERVQLRRKRAAINSERTGYGASLIDIYRRALQGGSEVYLAVNQKSEPFRVEKIQTEARERRDRRNAKRNQHPFVPHPERRGTPASATSLTAPSRHYTQLPSGQVVGYPRTMCEVKSTARQARLIRRAKFRAEKRAA